MHSLDELIGQYARLEEQVHEAIAGFTGLLCAECREPCCHVRHCAGTGESAWLRAVAAARGIAIPRENVSLDFLGAHGCTLPAGRPMECTWYQCEAIDRFITSPLDRFIYQVYSCLLGYVARNLSRDRDLTDYEELEGLTVRQRERLAGRMREARACLAAARRLQADTRPGDDRTPRDLLRLAAVFPFAARTAHRHAMRHDNRQPGRPAADARRTGCPQPKT